MTLVRFLNSDGALDREVEAAEGANLLDVAQAADQPLEGTCDKSISCSTCHVILSAEDFARMPRASEEEEDLLDLAQDVRRTSRLACQLTVSGAVMTVRMPG
ncbi:2Fe-2S iron-sulfur cluster-binding protein [Sphingomonas astaxanthinifaciens]|uniref:Ferredoxin n=1 Tax=Sphingomonas astaxanthinifaciens DSM 22298 TaxID=1123267 RepID=A0ABQ5ZAC0_9SPHN|nr:2Fe-2S iron-sulfur cluster-binding protein [Sphingomonas astaxanthinifaciens]GLR48431.1 ferredoxin [Sphingomonas astaxanthinifaciens DSM 22298]